MRRWSLSPPRRGVDPLAVLAAVDEDGVARLRDGGGPVDRPERAVLGAVGGVGPGGGDVEHRCHGGRKLSESSAAPSLGWRHVQRRSLRLALRDARPALRRDHQPRRSSSSAWPPAAAGPRARPTSRPAATWCGPTSPTTGCCAGTSATEHSRRSGRPRDTPTATPSIARAGWSAASTSRAGSPEPRATARSPCWPTATRASA